jgi:hypothetical protein
MAVKRKSRHKHDAIHATSDEGLEKAAQLAPLEERARKSKPQNSNAGGVIRVDPSSLKLPKDFTEQEEGKSGLLGLEPITIVILTFALAFIALMTYLISIEPPKAKDEPAPAPVAESPR